MPESKLVLLLYETMKSTFEGHDAEVFDFREAPTASDATGSKNCLMLRRAAQ
jgi:hypothetical protein